MCADNTYWPCCLALALIAASGCSSDDQRSEALQAGAAPSSSGTSQNDRLVAPQFPGAGNGNSGHSIGAGIETVGCGDRAPAQPVSQGVAADEEVTIVCFYGEEDEPAASIEWVVETAADDELVHIRLTFDPDFVDNSFGEHQIGWGEDGAKDHKLKDLVGSDHAQMRLTDGDGEVVLEFKVDYISESDESPSGYATLGVSGGDGKMIEGDEDDIVEVSTSLDRNFNECGLVEYTEDSPRAGEDYAPGSEAPQWDYRVVYDVWAKRSAFGAAGFGEALIDKVHASPSKGDGNTIEVTPGECPPDWCMNPDGCEPPEERCNPLDEGCGRGSDPPGVPLDCESLPEGCERPD